MPLPFRKAKPAAAAATASTPEVATTASSTPGSHEGYYANDSDGHHDPESLGKVQHTQKDGDGDGDDNEAEPGADLAQVNTSATEDVEYPSGLKLALLLTSVFISMFLVALDRLIIATAIPQITDDFHSVEDIGWYGSAYLLATCAFQLMFGKGYMFYSIKTVFLAAVGLFEIGSAVCGAAPSSVAFIIGRAIAGIGAAGIFSGVIIIIVYAVPLHKRPLYQGMFGAVFGLASVIGPLLGGAFTTNVTWRWCFYINLPLGGVAMVFIFFLLKIPDRATTKIPTKDKLRQLDGLGTFFFIPGCVSLLLALEWGGATYAWSNGRIIALLTLAGVLLIGFVLVQAFMPDTATVPARIFVQRSIMAGVYSTLCIGAQMMIFIYYLPIWFQAIQGVSAVNSGIRTLPLVLGMVVASIGSGVAISRVGYYSPFMISGVVFMSIGAGLLTTLQVDTGSSKWIGYQVLFGFGMGLSFQTPNLAAQTVLPRRDVPIGTSLMFFSQLLGGAIFVSVGQNVLDAQLIQRLAGIPGLDAASILGSGATSLTHLPDDIKPVVLVAYNEALRKVFQIGLIMVCLTIIGALSIEWRSVKKNLPDKNAPAEGKAEEGTSAAAATSEKAAAPPVAAPGSATTTAAAGTSGRTTPDTDEKELSVAAASKPTVTDGERA
ncbi:MFS aflatoxin efflux pump [Sporothrix brasiliensis 5110]|uniref:MFS aflatoxin efflux pump n=1 Tax=Sporothrix brasiliensis 5110 TaxID=1398154 RepID=A0A0C2IF54_9PEZI|nr:MFS aflatoxin efflux pump [Sporothrix brasiliensis 5110]KIH87846.1 MFS aflatoxin efflux pump [Sporothrix brasiliensis 5110]